MADKNPLVEAFHAAIKGQIQGDTKHGWGQADSLAVIEAVVAEDATQEAKKPGASLEKYTPSEAAMKLIAEVVNPSAFRQKLETKGILNKSHERKVKDDILAGYA